MSEPDYEVVIIGGGPAGLSAAIYTSRANLDTLIIDKSEQLLARAETIDNYFGFPEGISGEELLARGKQQAERFGTGILEEEAFITRLEGENYIVETAGDEFTTESLIIASGIQHEKPPVEGIEKFEGRGVSYCVVCDAPLYRDKKVGLLGSEDKVVKEALELYEFTQNIKIFTNGKELNVRENLRRKMEERNIPVEKRKIKKVLGEETVSGVEIESKEEKLDGLMVAQGTSGSLDFARSLGVTIEEGVISVDKNMFTGVPKVYAAGDCIGGPRQISTAVGEGTKAALSLINKMREGDFIDWG